MALFEHDINTGQGRSAKSASALNRLAPGKLFKGPSSDKDAFSGKILEQFSKGMITGKQFTGSMKLQGVQEKQLGTMVNFMKSDLRIQASTNQLNQKGFRLNKDSLGKLSSYYQLDEKVRKEEREFYRKTKDLRKKQIKKDKEEQIFRHSLLKAMGGIASNTQTLQTAKRLAAAATVTSKLGQAGGALIGGTAGLLLKPFNFMKRRVNTVVKEQRKGWRQQSSIQKSQNLILKGLDKSMGVAVKTLEKIVEVETRANKKRVARDSERARILESQGVGPRQTRHDRQVLKRLEQKKVRDAKKVGGFFASDEEREARANLKKESRELKVLRKRGFTKLDIQKAAAEGVDRRELVESGRHRRRTGRGIGRGLGRAAGSVGRLGGKLLPGLALVGGAAMAASKFKEGDIVGGIGSAAAAAASVIPGLGPLVSIAIEALTQLLPEGINESIKKFAGKIFGDIFAKLGIGGGTGTGGGMMAEFGKLFVEFGDALRGFGDMVMKFLLSEPVQTTLKQIFDFVVETGKFLIGGLTGLINFFVDIFSGEKGFVKAFMDNIGPLMLDLTHKLIPKASKAIWGVFKIMAEGVKTLVVSIIGKTAAKMFGIVVDTEKPENKILRGGRMIVENQEAQRSSAKQAILTGGSVGRNAISAYNKAGGGVEGLRVATQLIRAAEQSGDISPSDGKSARTALVQYHSATRSIAAGKALVKKAKSDEKNASGGGGATTSPSTSGGAPAITPTVSSSTTSTPTTSTPGGKSSSIPTPTGSFGEGGGGRIKNKKDPDPSNLTPVGGGHKLESNAAQAWKAMVAAARKDGIKTPLLSVKSGYRSSKRQAELFNKAIAKYGSAAAARKWVAPPGGSAHQSGRAVDLNLGIRNSSANTGAQRKTQVWAWLNENATKFGFYPYKNEPWHWEYNPPSGGIPSVSNVATSTPMGAEDSPSESGQPGAPGGGLTAAVGGISGVIGGFADNIMSQGANFASGIAGLPGVGGAMAVGGNLASMVSTAMQGASTAAMQEMQRVNTAMSNALQGNPAMKAVNNNMDQMARHTQAMANKHDDPNNSDLRAKRNRSVEALFSPYRSTNHFTG